MKHLAWLTDLHLNFLTPPQIEAYVGTLKPFDGLLISGDISDAKRVIADLKYFVDCLEIPIYFVLGNHDFYHSSIATIRQRVQDLCQQRPLLKWLGAEKVIELAPQVGLVGHDGWGDGRLGSYAHSVMMNDDILINELSYLAKPELFERLRVLGDEAAEHFKQVLPLAVYPELLVLTHVPPFQAACWHEGQISDERFLPRFTCQAVGEVLHDWAAAHPEQKITVLCGHTHGQGEVDILPNLHVSTGGTDYGLTKIQRVLTYA